MALPPFSLDNPDTLFFWQYSGKSTLVFPQEYTSKSTVMSQTVISLSVIGCFGNRELGSNVLNS